MNKFFASLMVLLFSFLFSNAANIKYKLSFPEPHTHYVEVEMRISKAKGKTLQIQMPTWAPGSYLIREFSKNVDAVTAFDLQGKELLVQKSTKNTWNIFRNGAQDLIIKYKVYARELSVRTSYIDADHAYLNGTSIFMYIPNRMQETHEVQIVPHPSWKRVSVELPALTPFSFEAPHYDALVDAPFEIGNHQEFKFVAAGIPHRYAVFGVDSIPEKKLAEDIQKIADACLQIFKHMPCSSYLFIVHHFPGGGGGLEHANSTTLQAGLNTYTNELAYKSFMGLVAHEYFHLWNVKRLRPHALGPFDYTQENYTRSLWISEGFTSYYDEILPVRAGIVEPERYLTNLARDINNVLNVPGDAVQSLSESSLDAWIKFYRRNENSQNTTVSYYGKGNLIALMLDLTLLKQSLGATRLDDFMRFMYNKYYLKLNRGFTDAEFKLELEKFSGLNFTKFYADFIDGTQVLPIEKYLAYVGLEVENINDPKIYTGIATRQTANGAIITQIARFTAGYESGLNVDDEIIKVNGKPLEQDFNREVATNKVGSKLQIEVLRMGKNRTFTLEVRNGTLPRYQTKQLPNPSEEQIYLLRKWLLATNE